MKRAWRCDDCGKVVRKIDEGHYCLGGYEGKPNLTEFPIITSLDIPEAEQGNVRVCKHRFEENTMVGSWSRPSFMKEGDVIVRLYGDGGLWMSNTPDEIHDCWFPIESPDDRGVRILVGGLGVGLILERFQMMTVLPEHVVIVEKNKDIFDLVAPTYESLPWLEIVLGDIWEWPKQSELKGYFDVAWMDIWGPYSTDLLPEMRSLRRRCRRVMQPGPGRVHIWQEEHLKYVARKEKKEERMWGRAASF